MLTKEMNFWERNRKLIPFFAADVALLLNGGLRILNIWLSPTGRVLNTLVFGIWVLQIAIFILLILNFILSLTNSTEMSDNGRTLYTALAVYVVVGLISIPISNGVTKPLQLRGYTYFTAENTFLVEAIEAYEVDNGRAPDSLEVLYPDYLPPSVATINEIETAAGEILPQIVFDVDYQSIDKASSDNVLYSYQPPEDDEPWQLQVSIYLGSFQSTRFIYNPTGRYSNRYVPLNGWAVD